MRFDVATKQLNDAKSKFEDAKTQLEAAASKVGPSSCACLEEENVKLRNEISQLQSEISKGHNTIRGMENDKVKLEAELKESRAETKRLEEENVKLGIQVRQQQSDISDGQNTIRGLEKDKLKLEADLRESRAQLDWVRKENNSLTEKNKTLEENSRGANSRNPKVFLDMNLRGVPVGRVVFKLFWDTKPGTAEIFRGFCTGQNIVSGTGKPFHYKGMSMEYLTRNLWFRGASSKGNLYGDTKIAREDVMGMRYTGSGQGVLYMCSYLENYKIHSFEIGLSEHANNLDPACFAIGNVIRGMEVLHALDKALGNDQTTYLREGDVVIANCGQL
ncbi:unnamed protein product [Rhodiola kirilowii]